MKNLRVVLFTLIVTTGFVSGQSLHSQSQNGYAEGLRENPGEKKLGAIAVIGDSLSAGFQNGTLLGCQQPNGFANLVVNQAVSSGTAKPRLVLPMMNTGFPPVLPPTGVPMRVDPLQQATDLAVPGQTVGQAITMRPVYSPGFPFAANPVEALTNLVLGFPGVMSGVSKSQVEWANALDPDTIVVWIGSNDVIGVFEGVQTTITDPLTFATNYDQLLSSLAKSHRRIVVANIPDVTLTPFIISLLPQLQQQDPSIVLKLKGLVAAYNAIIGIVAAKNGAPVVDVYSLVNKLAADGFKAGVQRLTTQAGGGLFSLDGVHPTNTGYAIIANEFIKTINRAYETEIEAVDVVSIANADPLTPFYLKQYGFQGYCVVPAVQLH